MARTRSNRRESILPPSRDSSPEAKGSIRQLAGPTPEDQAALCFQNGEQFRQAVLDNSDEIFATLHRLRSDYWDLIASHNQLAESNKELMVENVRLEGGCNVLTQLLEKAQERLEARDRVPSVSPPPPTPPPPPPPPSNDGSSAPTVPSASSESVASKKSIKLPDPPVLIDGLDPLFKHWLAEMRSKLWSDSDRYPTEVLRMDYIESRCDGAAMSHLVPRRRKDAPRPFVTGEEMFDLLEKVYGDPNRQHTSMNKFRALRMKDKDFNTFWAEFLRLSADLDHGDATLISELTHKLTPSLQRQLATGEKQPTDLYKYAERCQRAYQGLKDADRNQAVVEKIEVRKAASSVKKSSATASAASSTPSASTQISRPFNGTGTRLTEEEIALLKIEDRCFRCKEVADHRPKCKKEWRPMAWITPQVNEVSTSAESEKASPLS